MDSKNTLIPLLVIGAHEKSEGYPNTLYRLRGLVESNLFDITEINFPIWITNGKKQWGIFRLVTAMLSALYSLTRILARYFKMVRPKFAYLPYPSTLLLFVFSLLPKKSRPELLVADVFISLYDTVVLDRALFSKNSWAAKLLRWIEWRACNCADILVVDTEENKKFLCSLLKLSEAKVVAIPLATDEENFKFKPYQPDADADACRVLFIGTLVPLHGIATILEAIRLLSSDPRIHFKLIGDGQDAHLVEQWQNQHGRIFEWERKWQSSSQLAAEIARADICLGIFGHGDKTQRVCPFKIYAYAAVGRPIITGHTEWLVNARTYPGDEIIAGVAVNDPVALAKKISDLAMQPEERIRLAKEAFYFYGAKLSNKLSTEKIHTIFDQPPILGQMVSDSKKTAPVD